MSKILSAIVKRSGPHPDFKLRLETLADGGLYPLPAQAQYQEFIKLANVLINMSSRDRGLVVTFASSTPGEGSSFVSYNIARHLTVMLDQRVLWVDGNFLAPQAKLKGQFPDFKTLLSGPENFGEVETGFGLSLVANGDMTIKQTDLLSGHKYSALLNSFRNSFPFTIIDAPPILESVDVGHIARPTDGLIVVIESRRLKGEVVQHSINTVRNQGVNVLGTVLNKRTFDLPGFIYKRLSGA